MLRAALFRSLYTTIMFISGLALSNLALPERFGSISLLILNASLLSLITGGGIDSMILYKVSNRQWNISQAFYLSWGIIAMQILILILLELGSWMLLHKTLLSAEGLHYFPIDVVYFAGLIVVEKYLVLFYCSQKSKKLNGILALMGLLYLLFLLGCYYFIKPAFEWILYLFAFQNLLQGIVLIIVFKYEHSHSGRIERKEFWNALRQSSTIMVTNVIQLFAYRVDFWLLKYFYDSYQVGLYAQANKFANLVWVVPNIFAQLLIPQFAQIGKDRLKDILSIALYSNLILAFAALLLMKGFYMFYLNPEYMSGQQAFLLMLPGYFFWAGVIYFAAFFFSNGRFSYNLLGSVLCFGLICILDIILIPKYGMNGAAAANSVVYTLVFFVYLFIFRWKYSLHFNDLLSFHKKSLLNVVKFVIK